MFGLRNPWRKGSSAPTPPAAVNGAAAHLAVAVQDAVPSPPESILVFPRRLLDNWGRFDGFRVGDPVEMAGRLLHHPLSFLPRTPALEADERYKQAVACVVPIHRETGRVWCYRRGSSEGRLDGLLSCLVGGHVSKADLPPDGVLDPLEILWRAVLREMGEELGDWGQNWRVHHPGVRLLLRGVVNDDSNPVGRVHFGWVYVLEVRKSDLPLAFAASAGAEAGWVDPAVILPEAGADWADPALAGLRDACRATGRLEAESWSVLVARHLSRQVAGI